ncbi:MAG: nucleotidyltransferase domain-containing protein [Dermatophilaceae bacterium]
MIATAGHVVGAVQQMLTRFDGIEGAFVYGSVAHGTARPGSDIDLFVVTVADLGPEVRAHLHSAVEQLQRGLGYRPDPVHVVEVFSAAQCADALAGPLVLRANHLVADGRPIDQIALNSDDLEILRALQDRRLVVRHSPVVDGLTALAGRQVTDAARRLNVFDRQVLTGIGRRSNNATPAPVPTQEDMP